MIAKEIESESAIGVLDGTFGDVAPALDKLLATGKVSMWRAHLINGTCWRNRVCEKGEPRPNDIPAMQKRAAKFEALYKKYPHIPYFLSPVLEHDEKDPRVVQNWVQKVREAAPNAGIVISAFSGATLPGIRVEKHGNQAKGDIISNDGESLFDAPPTYCSGAKTICFGWINRYNLRVTGEKTFTPPSKRKHRASRDDVRQVTRILRPLTPKPAAPKACKNTIDIVAPELWKTNAEDYGNGDARGNRPLLIGKTQTSRMTILAPDGREVGCTKYYGRYADTKLNRHYEGSCSGKSPVKLMDDAKSEWMFLKDRGLCMKKDPKTKDCVEWENTCRRINAIRRLGYYR